MSIEPSISKARAKPSRHPKPCRTPAVDTLCGNLVPGWWGGSADEVSIWNHEI